jgi:CPA2 family monovalent cation:H+ antiporter-2
MMLTPFVFRFMDRLTPRLLRDQADEEQPGAEQPEAVEGHVVVLGYGKLGRRVGALLAEQGVSYQAVEYDAASFEHARNEGHSVYYGNAAQRQMLEHLHLDEASAVVIAMSNPSRISLVVQSVRALVPEVPISVCGEDRKHCEELMALGVDEPIDILDKEAEALVAGLDEVKSP